MVFASISIGGGSLKKTWRVATIQHSADTWKGGYTTYKNNFNNLRRMSLEALQADPDIILWSETAFVPSVAWHENYPSDPATSALVEEFVAFGKSLPVPLVTGNPECRRPFPAALLPDGSWNRKDYNTLFSLRMARSRIPTANNTLFRSPSTSPMRNSCRCCTTCCWPMTTTGGKRGMKAWCSKPRKG